MSSIHTLGVWTFEFVLWTKDFGLWALDFWVYRVACAWCVHFGFLTLNCVSRTTVAVAVVAVAVAVVAVVAVAVAVAVAVVAVAVAVAVALALAVAAAVAVVAVAVAVAVVAVAVEPCRILTETVSSFQLPVPVPSFPSVLFAFCEGAPRALHHHNFSIPSTTFPPHVKPLGRVACGLRPDHRRGRESGD